MRLALVCVIAAACGGDPAAAVCGDGIHAPGEVCDDGNTQSGDGCRADCGKLEICGDGIVDDGEACDDGNANPVDGCDACHPTRWEAVVLVGGPDAPGDDGVAATAVAIAARGLAVTPDGALVIASADRVRRVDAAGVVTTIAGGGTDGDGDGPAVLARLAAPDGIALDGAGGYYVAERDGNRVRHVDAVGAIALVAGTGDATGALGDGGDPRLASLAGPTGLAVDAAGALYIADTGHHAVRRVTAGTITTVAGTGDPGDDGDGGPAIAAHLTAPVALALDAAGGLVIADAGAHRVRVVTASHDIAPLAGTGAPGFAGDGDAATAAQLDRPTGLAVDGTALYIADAGNQRIRAVTAGTIATIAGGAATGRDGDGGPATTALLGDALAGLAVDPVTHALYAADAGNAAVRRIAAGTITTVAGAIDPPTTGPVAVARLADPRALAFAGQLLLVAGGSSGALEAVGPTALTVVAGRYPQAAATADLARFRDAAFPAIGGVAVDATAAAIYVSEPTANRIDRIAMTTADPETWTIAAVANVAGAAGAADGAAATATFRGPTGLYLDESRRVLYIADTGNHAIRALDLVAQTVTTPIGTPGTPGAGGDGGPPRAATLSAPEAVVRCASGDIYVADTGNDRIRRISASATPIITTIAGDSGDDAVIAPRALGCDELGNLYFTATRSVFVAPANDIGTADGSIASQLIYRDATDLPSASPPRSTTCLTGLVVVAAGTAEVADSCSGLLLELRRD